MPHKVNEVLRKLKRAGRSILKQAQLTEDEFREL